MHSPQRPETPSDASEEVRRVVDDVLVRRARGEAIPDERVCAEHPDLAPELAAALTKLRLIERARSAARPDGRRASSDVTTAYLPVRGQSLRLSQSLEIRCPLCHEPLAIVADQSLDDLHCRACQGRFSLAGDDPQVAGNAAVTQIARFELRERLGMGGFGTVWKARDVELDRIVALKIPRRCLGEQEAAEFLHEARVAARLRHPHIVSVHEVGRHGDIVYIVSDLVEGVSLQKFTEARRLTHREAAELLITVCEAVHCAHEKGIVHRDLKPGNILIDAAGQPHITDFGLATRGTDEVAITSQGEILGTPAYMSPEQARGEAHRADRRTDVYALGVILYELLTGFLPFRGTVTMLLHHAVHTEPFSPRTLNRSIPHDLATICLKCLEKEPARRYDSAQALADELRRFLAGDPIHARRASRTERVWRWCKKHPRIPALSAALLAVVLVAYAIAWWWLDERIAAADRALTAAALENVRFTAASAAATAGHDFEQYFERVEQSAREPELIDRLRATSASLAARAEYAPLLEAGPEVDLEPLRERLRIDALRDPLREWARHLPRTGDAPELVWFVLLADGMQIARHPETEGGVRTIGTNYAYRAYYHGGDRDLAVGDRPPRSITATTLSPAFLTQHTKAWMVTVSTPIYGEPATRQELLGILGLMVPVGALVKLPGDATREATRFAVLVDSRGEHAGQILQHPLHDWLASERTADGVSRRWELIRQSQQPEFRVAPGGWDARADYRDPFARAWREYDRRWLAGRWPVRVAGRPTGLQILVQEDYDQLIGRPLAEMRQGLIVLSLVTLVFSAAAIVPLWGVILRLVR